MAPLIHLLALFALSTAVLASPHVSRNVYNHAHRAVVRSPIDVDARALPLPRRQRSLNKRCVPRPTTNSTISAVPTSAVPTSTAPINVAPLPTLPTSSPSSAAGTPSYAPPSQAPTTTPSASSSSPSVAYSPTTTSTPPPPSTPTSSTPAPAQTSSSSSNSGEPSYMTGTQSGQGTFFADGLGACGITNTDSDHIVAVAESLFDTYPGYDGVNPNTNPVCGKQITATYGGISVTVTVADRCTGCNLTDLDFSTSAFDILAAAALGRIPITWKWT